VGIPLIIAKLLQIPSVTIFISSWKNYSK